MYCTLYNLFSFIFPQEFLFDYMSKSSVCSLQSITVANKKRNTNTLFISLFLCREVNALLLQYFSIDLRKEMVLQLRQS
jgi:hypothetical protein